MNTAFDILIRQAQVLDGTGCAARGADVGVRGGRIAAIGDLAGSHAEHEIDAAGRCLAPGFIDVHTHDDLSVVQQPDMTPKLSQGVTTVVVGNCGISAAPVRLPGSDVPDPMNLLGQRADFRFPRFADYAHAVDEARPSVNVAALVGHTALRANHMQDLQRAASATEIENMRRDLTQALDEGAIGMSSGLAYYNARHAPREEVAALVAELGRHDAVYTTHLRDEFDGLPEAMDEAFETADKAGARLVISHLKCAGADNWGNAPKALAALEQAARHQACRCDCYPYTAGSSTLDLGQVTDRIEIYITWSEPHPEMAPGSLTDIAARWDLPLREAARRLQPAGAIYHNMDEADMRRILAHPLSMIGSDGLPNDPFPHPRLWGTFARVLGHYCRDKDLFSLPFLIQKMTTLSAMTFGLHERGVLRAGAWADMVLFDADNVIDRATFTDPKRPCQGIDTVLVNGQVAWHEGRVKTRAGRLLRRQRPTTSQPSITPSEGTPA